MDLEKAYYRVNREALWQVLRMYDAGGKLLSVSRYFNILACVRIKGSEGEALRIDSGVRQRCTLSHWLFNVYKAAVLKEV